MLTPLYSVLASRSRALPSKPTPVRRAFGSRLPLSEKENMSDLSNKPASSPSAGIVNKPSMPNIQRGVSKKRKLAAPSSSPLTTASSTQKTIQPSKRPPTSLPPRPTASSKDDRIKMQAQSTRSKCSWVYSSVLWLTVAVYYSQAPQDGSRRLAQSIALWRFHFCHASRLLEKAHRVCQEPNAGTGRPRVRRIPSPFPNADTDLHV